MAAAVLGKSTWAVLALTCHIELFTLAHYRASIEPDTNLSELYKDVFLFHWKEESQHAILDELEWRREDAQAHARGARRGGRRPDRAGRRGGRHPAGAVERRRRLLRRHCGRAFPPDEADRIRAGFLKAYRWQYIVSGVTEPRFQKILFGMIDAAQTERIVTALAPLMAAVPAKPRASLPMAA